MSRFSPHVKISFFKCSENLDSQVVSFWTVEIKSLDWDHVETNLDPLSLRNTLSKFNNGVFVLSLKISIGQCWLDMVVLSKTVLLNFCPNQAKEWIGALVFWIIELFIAILTWPYLTGYNRPLSLFFHPLTLPG